MAFETPVLDPFTGADEDPITTNWSGPIYTGLAQMRRVSNQLAPNTAAFCGSWFDVATYGPDCESYVTLAAKFGADASLYFYARGQSVGTTSLDGYVVQYFESSGTDLLRLSRIDDGVGTPITSFVAQEVSVGDKIGIRCIGDEISLWYWSSGGGWVQLDSAIDSTYPNAGHIGFSGDLSSALRLDDLGGGTVVAAVEPVREVTIRTSRRMSW